MENNAKLLDDVTIVIQGRTDPECLKHWADKYGPSCIVSTWKDCPIDPLGMKVIYNDKPSDPGPQNSNYQIISTLAGLREATTNYVIKVRGDEYYSNMEYIVEEMKKTNKILTLPIFFRPHNVYPFHPSDHLLAGWRKSLRTMYKSAMRMRAKTTWSYRHCPEQLLGAAYLETVMNTQKIVKEHMKLHFDILDLERVKDYKICYNGMGVKYYNNFDPKVNGAPAITSMDEL